MFLKKLKYSVNDVEAVFMVIKIINSCFSEYEKKTQISNFSVKFDYNILKHGKIKIFHAKENLLN